MSQSTHAGLQILLQQLERRREFIKRAASLLKISFGKVEDQQFSVHVWWKGGELIKVFRYNEYYHAHPRPSLKVRPCQVTRQFIQEILNHRGI